MKASQAEIIEFLQQEFPQSLTKCQVVAVADGYAKVSLNIDQADLRPGGTVSGPSMFALADFAFYVAILAELGIVALAVTSQLNIHFLRKPLANFDLLAECRLIKVGKTMVVGEVWVYSAGMDAAVAQVTGSYILP